MTKDELVTAIEKNGTERSRPSPNGPRAGSGPPSSSHRLRRTSAPAVPTARTSSRAQRGDDQGGFDVDLLLNEALNAGSGHGLDPTVIHQHAYRLRTDTIAGRQVNVYEIQRQAESQVTPGQSRLRYWVDAEAGNLLRLEIRTRTGGFGQLDVSPGAVPYLQ